MSAQEVQPQWASALARGGLQQEDVAPGGVSNGPGTAEQGSRRGSGSGGGHDNVGAAVAAAGACQRILCPLYG